MDPHAKPRLSVWHAMLRNCLLSSDAKTLSDTWHKNNNAEKN